MRAYIARSHLLSMMSRADRVVSKDSQSPAMGSALIVAEGGTLAVTSSDGRRWVRCVSPANVEEPGVTAVSARRLAKFMKLAPDGPVEIESDDSVANVRCDRARANLMVIGAETMSAFPRPATEASVTVRSEDLLTMSKAASKMVIRDNSKPVQQGIHLVAKKGSLRMEACSSFLAATCEASCGGGDLDVVVPPQSFSDAVSANDGEVTVGAGNGSLCISTSTSTYVTRVIEGTFPNVGMLFGGSWSSSAVVDTADMMAALDLLSAIDAVSVRLASGDDGLVMSAYGDGDGLIETVVEASVAGDVDINLNPRNIRDVAAMGGDMELRFQGGVRPVIAVSERYGWRCAMMPMVPTGREA